MANYFVDDRCAECGDPFEPGEQAVLVAKVTAGNPPDRSKHRSLYAKGREGTINFFFLSDRERQLYHESCI